MEGRSLLNRESDTTLLVFLYFDGLLFLESRQHISSSDAFGDAMT